MAEVTADCTEQPLESQQFAIHRANAGRNRCKHCVQPRQSNTTFHIAHQARFEKAGKWAASRIARSSLQRVSSRTGLLCLPSPPLAVRAQRMLADSSYVGGRYESSRNRGCRQVRAIWGSGNAGRSVSSFLASGAAELHRATPYPGATHRTSTLIRLHL